MSGYEFKRGEKIQKELDNARSTISKDYRDRIYHITRDPETGRIRNGNVQDVISRMELIKSAKALKNASLEHAENKKNVDALTTPDTISVAHSMYESTEYKSGAQKAELEAKYQKQLKEHSKRFLK